MKVLTWNLSKRRKASMLAAVLLEEWGIDIALLQESSPMTVSPPGYHSIVTPDSRPDTQILVRSSAEIHLSEPSPLRWFGSYGCVGRTYVDGLELELVSVHTLARAAQARELVGLDIDQVRRPDVAEPWLNDVAIFMLMPHLSGRRFLVGADLNTSRFFQAGSLLDRVTEAGWVELIEMHHGIQVPTFFTSRSKVHQLDYLFTDVETARSCVDVIVHSELTDGIGDGTSDHAPVVATFVDLKLEPR